MSEPKWAIRVRIKQTKVNEKAVAVQFSRQVRGPGMKSFIPGVMLMAEVYTGRGDTVTEAENDAQFKLMDQRETIKATIAVLEERSEELRLAIVARHQEETDGEE